MPLIDRLTGSGVRVLLPLLCEDFDLEWAVYEPGELTAARFGIMQPTGRSLGKGAIAEAGIVFCPGVAGTARGERLGRGGGSYDRALGRADPAATRCLLLYDDEVLASVPVEPHDELVDYLCTPTRLIEASPGRFEHQGGVGR
jgi:5-formyltetrahydrofolate cyclo-ligase